jgi:hypothetical protein
MTPLGIITANFRLAAQCLNQPHHLVPRETDSLLKKYNLPLNKLVCVVTDGVHLMIGSKYGLAGKTNENFCSKFQSFHCMLHQKVLCIK